MRTKILSGGMLFALILAVNLSYNSYQRFTTIITQNHKNYALRTAQTALTFLDADNFSVQRQDILAHQKIMNEWQRITDAQEIMFIYVIEPFNEYNNIRFIMSVRNTDSDYDVFCRKIISELEIAESFK